MRRVLAIVSIAMLLVAFTASASASPVGDDSDQSHDRTTVGGGRSGDRDDEHAGTPNSMHRDADKPGKTAHGEKAKRDNDDRNDDKDNGNHYAGDKNDKDTNDQDDNDKDANDKGVSGAGTTTPAAPAPVVGTDDVLLGIAPVAGQPNACNWAGHMPGVSASNDGSDVSFCVWGVMPVGTWIRYPLASSTSLADFRVYMPCTNVTEDGNRPGHPPSLYEIWVGTGTDMTGATKIGGGSSTCGTDAGFVTATVTATGSSVFYVATADCDTAPACDATVATISAHAWVEAPTTAAAVTTAPSSPAGHSHK